MDDEIDATGEEENVCELHSGEKVLQKGKFSMSPLKFYLSLGRNKKTAATRYIWQQYTRRHTLHCTY
jgi:hypothetical protein